MTPLLASVLCALLASVANLSGCGAVATDTPAAAVSPPAEAGGASVPTTVPPAPTSTPSVSPVTQPTPMPTPTLQQFRAFWVDAFHDGFKTPQQVDQLLAAARAAQANAIIVQVRRRGDAYFNRSLEPRTEDPAVPAGFDPLQDLLDKAHGQQPRIEVHAWMATFPIWTKELPVPTTPNHVYHLHGAGAPGAANWMSLNRQGQSFDGSNVSLDPGNPDALRNTVDIALDLVRQYPIDGLHFDYVRYADRDWGYNPTSLERFQRLRGGSPNPAPDDPAWSQWRRDQVTAFLRQAYLRALALRPELKVSAATIAWGDAPESDADWPRSAAMSRAYQDWRAWLQEGIVDIALPMAYFRDDQARTHASFDGWTRWTREHRYGRHGAVGVGALMNTLPATVDQVSRALAPDRNQAVDGVALYSYAAPAGDDARATAPELARALATRDGPFAVPARPPDMPWKTQPERGGLMGLLPAKGEAADGAEVRISGPSSATTRTDGTGFFGFAALPPGEYAVEARVDGKILLAGSATVHVGRVTEWRTMGG